jgi:TolB protein
MNADGSGLTRLTNNPADDRMPDWSPDGTCIAFHSNRDGNEEIYIMNADGSGVTYLAEGWSP